MDNLTLNDITQKVILDQLQITERLLSKLCSNLSNTEKYANIKALPDLGMPLNVERFMGGFFTGAYYSWDSETPFIPIDTTMNSCGVSMYRVSNEINSIEHFNSLINDGRKKIENSSTYLWNLNRGNHFISFCKCEGSNFLKKGYYVVHHSSASEWKKQINGLYPEQGNWFFNNIKTIYDDKVVNRYLRYISGKDADTFFTISKMLESLNYIRHQHMVGFIFGEENIEEEISNLQHYGMPTYNSAAIGANWLFSGERYVLLTERKKNILLVENIGDDKNSIGNGKFVTPHGLGMKSKYNRLELNYLADGIKINDKNYNYKDRLNKETDIEVRSTDHNSKLINDILSICHGNIIGELIPIYSYDYLTK